MGDDRIDRELRYHFERLVREYIAAGTTPEEARRRARLEFGGVEQIKEECRDVRGRWIADFFKDLRYAARTLRRSPGFLAVAVVSLALGIGANTAIFSLITAVMLRTLPVKEPDRLVLATRLTEERKPGVVSYPLFEYFRDNLKSLTGASAELSGNPAITMDAAEELVESEMVSGGHYAMLGVEPAAGRLRGPEDDVVSPTSPAAVISYRYWQRRFGSSPAAIGKTFRLRDMVFTIVGVTPPRYYGTRPGREPDITLPLTAMLPESQRREAGNNMLSMMARLAPGVTVAQADAELQVLWRNFKQRMAAEAMEKERPGILARRAAVLSAATGVNPLRSDYSQALLVLMGMVGLVLLLACANLSGLLVARAAAREREISIRLAIGAGRGRLLRQFLTESFLLAVLGGSAGLLLAGWFSRALVTMLANGGKLLLDTAPDWRVLAFTSALSLAACMLAGLAPGVHAFRAGLNPALKQVRAAGHHRTGKALLIGQLAISMMLLVGAALFVDTLVRLYGVDRGLRTDGVLTFSVRARARYPQARSWAVQQAILERLRALPGVTAASASRIIPLSGNLWTRYAQPEGYTFRADESEDVGFNAIGPQYFATLGTQLVSGREFDERDTNTANKVTIVNESFAGYFFHGKSPLGKHVTSVKVTYEIVGVVKDAKYQDLRQEVLKTMYIPLTQREDEQPVNFTYLARLKGIDPTQSAAALEKLVRDADPGLRLRAAQTYNAVLDHSIVTERIMATLGGFFGILALIVAGLGIFGVMAFQVSRRMNEIGVRMALGASRGGIVTMVLRDVAWVLAAGCAIGAGAALTLTGLTRKILFGVTPADPAVFAMAAAVLGAAALVAGWIPARRAAGADPMTALRHD